MRPSPSPLEPPLEVLETFGGAKVSDDNQLQKGAKHPNTSDKNETKKPKHQL